MAVDFSHLLKSPTGQAKRPPALPIGTYPGIIKGYEFAELFGQQKVPGVRFMLAPLDFPDAVDLGEREGIELNKRQLRKEFSIADADIWQLEAFLSSIGAGGDGSTNEENIPKAVGARVLMDVQQNVNPNTSEINNRVGKMVGQQ